MSNFTGMEFFIVLFIFVNVFFAVNYFGNKFRGY